MGTKLKSPSTRDRVFEIVRAQLARVRREQAPDFNAEIRMESSLVADLGFDSLSLVEALVAIEQAFHIERLSLEALNDDSDGACLTVESLVNLCVEQVPPRRS